MKEFIIGKNEANQRFDKYIKKVWKDAPSSVIYKLLRKKTITKNGKKADASDILAVGDQIKFFVTDETFAKFAGPIDAPKAAKKKDLHIKIIYEDSDIVLLNKPWGVLSQKAEPADYAVTDFVVDYALEKGYVSAEELKTFRPGICSRLDRNTSGIMTAGVSLQGLKDANELIRTHELNKYYLAIVKGHMPKKKDILKAYHIKDHKTNQVSISTSRCEGSECHEVVTGYEVLAEGCDCTLIKVLLITGQTHQIRAHLASIHHPLAGDLKYGDAKWNEQLKKDFKVKRQMLHAYELTFPKVQGALEQVSEKTFTATIPDDFLHAMRGLEIQWQPGTAED